jgi:hypothetical protein
MNFSLFKRSVIIILFVSFNAMGQVHVSNRPADQTIVFENSKLKMTVDYNRKCVVTDLQVNGEPVLSDSQGICSEIRTLNGIFSTGRLNVSPKVTILNDKIVLSGICYGNDQFPVGETWTFILAANDIKLNIERTVSQPFVAEEVLFPSIHFKNMNTWDGAFLGYGGIAWFYLFNQKLCTYGVHTGSSRFWNSASGNGLDLLTSAAGKQIASKFTRTADDRLNYTVSVSDNEMKYRYDAGTNRCRFVREKTDVWDSFNVSAGKYAETVTFSWFDYKKNYDRGHLAGINGDLISKLLSTIARMGVIDSKLFGGNSWHTPYGPICLHEQYIAQLEIGINDPAYTEGYKQCLEYYRDQAIQPDGRVLPRWAYIDEDSMPGKATPLGFYEAQWGYLLDSNPDFVANVSELYNQCGDLTWVKSFKLSCEQALDYLLKRDSNGNHLVEMICNSLSEKKSSDWIDVIWASYENAFINAKLYHALILWADIEKQLGDESRANDYSNYASALKTSFNKPTSQGGFWSEKNQWYVHWLEKDGSAHGDNLVTPVNFMAIAYGLCDNEQRKEAVLDRVEDQMKKENLFAWPICLYPYEKGEGADWQFPFPNYENGDIFLSWGALGVESYAVYKPNLALKYVENILARYKDDGLAFQRYGRLKQDGLGDDILSGNSLAIVGLYKSIYGINPCYNRLYLNPHLPKQLDGTILKYKFRNQDVDIHLNSERYSVSFKRFKLTSSADFGVFAEGASLKYFNRDQTAYSLKVTSPVNLKIEIENWDKNGYAWRQMASSASGKITYSLPGLSFGKEYEIRVNDTVYQTLKCDRKGNLEFSLNAEAAKISIR